MRGHSPPFTATDGSAIMILYRPHRGGLHESMRDVREVASFPELVRAMRADVLSWYPIDQLPTEENTKLEPYGYDERIGWQTYLVTVDGHAWGYINGVPEDGPHR